MREVTTSVLFTAFIIGIFFLGFLHPMIHTAMAAFLMCLAIPIPFLVIHDKFLEAKNSDN